MSAFLTDLPRYPFLQYALLTGLLVSVACGIIGSYVVTKRITYIAGSIAHTVLGGLGAARYFQTAYGWEWLHPLDGADPGVSPAWNDTWKIPGDATDYGSAPAVVAFSEIGRAHV